jgi:rhamnose utilization protein RhaD (predicted bifunctional aldolase and dehydrogenase)
VYEHRDQLLWLSHEIGREDRSLALLGEGNCSAKLGPDTFAIKSSGSCLSTLRPEELTDCHLTKVLALIEMRGLEGSDLDRGLMDSQVNPDARRPSIETPVHGWLLQLENVNFVAHCHPEACMQILCSNAAEAFATQRLFPDQIAYCGTQSVVVPYADPGVPIAREIRAKVMHHMRRNYGRWPRLILLQNRGIIAIGPNAAGVLACILMAEKAARIFGGAARLGGAVFLPAHQSQRLDTRPEDGSRQREMRT